MARLVIKNFRTVDADAEFFGSLVVENGIITKIINKNVVNTEKADVVIDGGAFGSSAVVMPAFIDLHAHFRDPGYPENRSSPPAEVLESASLAAIGGGYTTVVCMANTKPVIDTVEKARALKTRSDALGLIDLYPVLSLTKNMEGKKLSGIQNMSAAKVLMLSEDGKDVNDDALFLAAMKEAKRLGIPVSCHCDLDGEANAVRRAIELGKKAGCHIHIAHVSTKETVKIIRETEKKLFDDTGFFLTCEATPHHIGATEKDARRMGDKSFGRVNPPLRSPADRKAIIAALLDGTIEAVATDHAPHTEADKAAGSPGFSGLETAFAVCLSHLCNEAASIEELQRLSALMSNNPAQILGLHDRGRIAEGLRADLVIVDTQAMGKVDPAQFKSRGKCSPFAGKKLRGKVIMTLNGGKIVQYRPAF